MATLPPTLILWQHPRLFISGSFHVELCAQLNLCKWNVFNLILFNYVSVLLDFL